MKKGPVNKLYQCLKIKKKNNYVLLFTVLFFFSVTSENASSDTVCHKLHEEDVLVCRFNVQHVTGKDAMQRCAKKVAHMQAIFSNQRSIHCRASYTYTYAKRAKCDGLTLLYLLCRGLSYLLQMLWKGKQRGNCVRLQPSPCARSNETSISKVVTAKPAAWGWCPFVSS